MLPDNSITLSQFEKNLMKKVDEIYERHRKELKELNKVWKERLCFEVNLYREHIGLKKITTDEISDEIPIIKEEVIKNE